jgi:hypothetical protein
MNRAAKLWRALDRFRRKPQAWTKGAWATQEEYNRGTVQRCLAGQIMMMPVNGNIDRYLGEVDRDPECQLVSEIIQEQFPERLSHLYHRDGPLAPGRVIPAFNDHHDTTLDDVLKVLEKAAIQCDEVLGS